MPVHELPTLGDIIECKRQAIANRKTQVPFSAVKALARMQYRRHRPLDLVSQLRNGRLSWIAQIKQATPIKGRIIRGYDPVRFARRFVRKGAMAVAVSTEQHYHKGGVDHLTLVRESVPVPVICHDYIIDEYQVYEVRATGADGLILMSNLLDDDALRQIFTLTQRLRMTAIVQVHNETEAARVRRIDPRVVGIICRDPITHLTDLSLPARLRALFPTRTATIAMGGLRTWANVRQVAETGIDGILVGEALLTASELSVELEAFTDISLPAPIADFRRSPGPDKVKRAHLP